NMYSVQDQVSCFCVVFVDGYYFNFSDEQRQPIFTLFPYTTLFRSLSLEDVNVRELYDARSLIESDVARRAALNMSAAQLDALARSEEHTSELQSREKLVCRLLL